MLKKEEKIVWYAIHLAHKKTEKDKKVWKEFLDETEEGENQNLEISLLIVLCNMYSICMFKFSFRSKLFY